MRRLHDTGIGKSVSASEWCEVEEFIAKNIITEARIQKEYECGKATGVAEGRNQAKTFLLTKAIEAFKASHDEEAVRLRKLASSL